MHMNTVHLHIDIVAGPHVVLDIKGSLMAHDEETTSFVRLRRRGFKVQKRTWYKLSTVFVSSADTATARASDDNSRKNIRIRKTTTRMNILNSKGRAQANQTQTSSNVFRVFSSMLMWYHDTSWYIMYIIVGSFQGSPFEMTLFYRFFTILFRILGRFQVHPLKACPVSSQLKALWMFNLAGVGLTAAGKLSHEKFELCN